jgi:glycosyltransferase involved in cell wall biosynthesis
MKWVADELGAVVRPQIPPPGSEPYILLATFRSTIGLGHSARRLATALQRAGKETYTIDVTEAFGLEPVVPWENNPPPAGSTGTLIICVQPPTLHRVLRSRGTADFLGRRWVGYWWWELERLPESWRSIAALADEFWCSSRFVYDCFARSVPEKPRHYVPLVIEAPQPSRRRLAEFGLPEAKFTVLSAFDLRSHVARKNPRAMIAAFKQAFGSRSDALYILKVTGSEKFPDHLAALQAEADAAANIRVVAQALDTPDLFALIHQADVVLSLHRSEGLGMVMAEAALSGTPVVATAWSGVLDFLDSESAGLVGFRLVPVDRLDNLPAPRGSRWAEADIHEAARWLQRLEAAPELRERLARAALQKARRAFGQAAFEEQLQKYAGAASRHVLGRT